MGVHLRTATLCALLSLAVPTTAFAVLPTIQTLTHSAPVRTYKLAPLYELLEPKNKDLLVAKSSEVSEHVEGGLNNVADRWLKNQKNKNGESEPLARGTLLETSHVKVKTAAAKAAFANEVVARSLAAGGLGDVAARWLRGRTNKKSATKAPAQVATGAMLETTSHIKASALVKASSPVNVKTASTSATTPEHKELKKLEDEAFRWSKDRGKTSAAKPLASVARGAMLETTSPVKEKATSANTAMLKESNSMCSEAQISAIKDAISTTAPVIASGVDNRNQKLWKKWFGVATSKHPDSSVQQILGKAKAMYEKFGQPEGWNAECINSCGEGVLAFVKSEAISIASTVKLSGFDSSYEPSQPGRVAICPAGLQLPTLPLGLTLFHEMSHMMGDMRDGEGEYSQIGLVRQAEKHPDLARQSANSLMLYVAENGLPNHAVFETATKFWGGLVQSSSCFNKLGNCAALAARVPCATVLDGHSKPLSEHCCEACSRLQPPGKPFCSNRLLCCEKPGNCAGLTNDASACQVGTLEVSAERVGSVCCKSCQKYGFGLPSIPPPPPKSAAPAASTSESSSGTAKGVPALIALVLLVFFLAIVTPLAGAAQITNYESAEEQRSRRLVYQHALIVAGLSIIFWIWAVINSITSDFDFGVISFLIAGVVAIFRGFRAAFEVDLATITIYKFLITITCALVALNYGAGVFVVDPAWQILYFVIGCLIWVLLSIWGWRSAYYLENAVSDVYHQVGGGGAGGKETQPLVGNQAVHYAQPVQHPQAAHHGQTVYCGTAPNQQTTPY